MANQPQVPVDPQSIRVPARYVDCTHVECFDLEALLRMKMQKNFSECPICQKKIASPLNDLRIDSYMQNVLSTLPQAMQIELHRNGSFAAAQDESPVLNEIGANESYIPDTDTFARNIKKELLEDATDYIDLSDSEEEILILTEVDFKPIIFMPLNVDVKPNVCPISQQETIEAANKKKRDNILNDRPDKAIYSFRKTLDGEYLEAKKGKPTNVDLKRKAKESSTVLEKPILKQARTGDANSIANEEDRRRDERNRKLLFLKGMGKLMKNGDLKALHPDVAGVRIAGAHAWLVFPSEPICEKAYKTLSTKKIDGKPIVLDFCGSKSKSAKTSTNPDATKSVRPVDPLQIVVTGIPKEATVEELKVLFPNAMKIDLKTKYKHLNPIAFIKFDNEKLAKEAFDRSASLRILSAPVDVFFARVSVPNPDQKNQSKAESVDKKPVASLKKATKKKQSKDKTGVKTQVLNLKKQIAHLKKMIKKKQSKNKTAAKKQTASPKKVTKKNQSKNKTAVKKQVASLKKVTKKKQSKKVAIPKREIKCEI